MREDSLQGLKVFYLTSKFNNDAPTERYFTDSYEQGLAKFATKKENGEISLKGGCLYSAEGQLTVRFWNVSEKTNLAEVSHHGVHFYIEPNKLELATDEEVDAYLEQPY